MLGETTWSRRRDASAPGRGGSASDTTDEGESTRSHPPSSSLPDDAKDDDGAECEGEGADATGEDVPEASLGPVVGPDVECTAESETGTGTGTGSSAMHAC
ncbi:hypothetical protein BCR44DRAFT_35798 [Catenaria anguillulae PL171]|uniref:Uncharacterized protein n=1 Tax=Catenaria anguillulae PL171 TaxID=765915 RepID=A0A1Y2HSG8_9FUNG|nr:hypothetical protein BCR44DRAFT_35798 [Catenaria anguillulae PL171]